MSGRPPNEVATRGRRNPRHVAYDLVVAAPPSRAWELLSRFEAYPHWTNWVLLSGGRAVGDPVDFSVPSPKASARGRRFTLPCRITRTEAQTIVWSFKIMGLRYHQSLSVTPDVLGTRLIHAYELQGPFAGFLAQRLSPALRAICQGLLVDARRRLDGGLRPRPARDPKPKRLPSLPRAKRGGGR